jgi:hypothetical protein
MDWKECSFLACLCLQPCRKLLTQSGLDSLHLFQGSGIVPPPKPPELLKQGQDLVFRRASHFDQGLQQVDQVGKGIRGRQVLAQNGV